MALSGALLLGTANHKVEAATNTPNTYIVKAGDTLWGISQKYGVSLNKIEALNNKSSLIHVGDKIKLTGAYTYTAPVVQAKVNYKASTQTGNQASNQTSYKQPATTQQSTASTQTGNQASNQTSTKTSYKQPATIQQSTASTSTYSNVSTGTDSSAKEQIAQAESGGSYTAVNASSGAYGKYQLLPQYLHGDYSPANQERVFQQYCSQRYGGVAQALSFRQAHGWY